MKKILVISLLLIFLINIIVIFLKLNPYISGNSFIEIKSEKVFVTKIIDGDTIVANGEHIRLLGMDADERGYECYKEAKKRLEELILNKEVILEKDQTDKDQYGRMLRYIILDNENINILMVKEGLAVARFYKDRKYEKEILSAETYSRNQEIGCKWSK